MRSRRQDREAPLSRMTHGKCEEDEERRKHEGRGAGRGRRRSRSALTRQDLRGNKVTRLKPGAKVIDQGMSRGNSGSPKGVPHSAGPWRT
eukprot:3427004-Heterocapsa_arctica.AAC.1